MSDEAKTAAAIAALQAALIALNSMDGFRVEAKTMHDGTTRYAAIALHGCVIEDGYIIEVKK